MTTRRGFLASLLAASTVPTLTWADAGEGNLAGAALGRGTLVCEQADACRVDGLQVIWRQTPKLASRGHYSHRIAFSPDGRYLFLSSGERQLKSLQEIAECSRAQVYLLDEWDANLDPKNRAAAEALVSQLAARAVVVEISHRDRSL